MKKAGNKNHHNSILIGLLAGTVLLTIVAVGLGRYFIEPMDVIKILASKIIPMEQTWEPQAESVIFTLRLPRILSALLVGMALALSGASYQGVFKNPLVAPDMLGVSAGACVGASSAILLGMGQNGVQISAFIGGILAVGIATAIPKVIKNNSMMTLVLAGVIVSGLMNSILGLLKYLADPDTELASITHWQLGSLSASVWRDVIYIGPVILLAAAVIILLRWRINILSLGEDEAKTLGTDIRKHRGVIIVCATALTASAVCISGTIGWIGLVIPHLGRMLVGPDNRKLIPVSAVLGAMFLLIIDTVARNITSAELPLSILTGLVGAPFYFYLLFKQRMKLS
ncbi:MAG: iron ABC transporter permease [Lachnospiraceae bacterium]|nr:iron ABC transporter permease [Lachnospiraceae bacterium]